MSIGAIASLAGSVIHPLYSAITGHKSHPQVSSDSGDSPQVSGPAQILSKLQDLAQSDPARFKQVTAGLANNFRKLAVQAHAAGSSSQADRLNQLAHGLQTASETGQAPNFGHHLNAHSGIQSVSQTAYSQAQSNPLDLLTSL